MIYRCEDCKYTTDKISNYKRHIKSKCHTDKINIHTQTIVNSYNTNNTTNNITNNNITNNNIILCGFRHEDLSQITEEDILTCFNEENKYDCVPAFIKLTNCNPRFPQNMNIIIKSLNRDHMTVYKEDTKEWITIHKSKEFDTFYQEKDMELGEFVTMYEGNHPHIRKFYDLHSKRCKEEPIKGVKSYYIESKEKAEFKLFDIKIIAISNMKKIK
jgi:hypothetical protein